MSFEDLDRNIVTNILEKMSPRSGARLATQFNRTEYLHFREELVKLKKWYDNIPSSEEILAGTNKFLSNAKVTLRAGDPFVYYDPLFDDDMDIEENNSIIPIFDISYKNIMINVIYPNTVCHDVCVVNCAYEKKMFGKLEIRDNNTYQLVLAGQNNTMVNVDVLKVFIGMPFVLPTKLQDDDWVITQKGVKVNGVRTIVQQALTTVNAAFSTVIENIDFTSAAQLHPVTSRVPKMNKPIGNLII